MYQHLERISLLPMLTTREMVNLERDNITRMESGRGRYAPIASEPDAKYVFVTDGKVYKIANQELALLQVYAGHTVQLTGT